jgi:hypothetical protein
MIDHLRFYLSLANLAHRVITERKLASELHQMMDDLGDQQFRNAMAAFEDAGLSSNPRHELTNAINHFQDAISLSKAAYGRADFPFWDRVFSGKGESDPNHPRYKIGQRISEAQSAIVLIYYKLGERKLALKYAEDFRWSLLSGYPSEYKIFVSWEGAFIIRQAEFAQKVKESSNLQTTFKAIEYGNKFLRAIGAKSNEREISVIIYGDAYKVKSAAQLSRVYARECRSVPSRTSNSQPWGFSGFGHPPP